MKYILKTATEQSVEALCSLFQDVFHKHVEPSAWIWKYQDPAASDHTNVVLCDDAGTVLGHAGAVVNRGMVNGKPVPVAQICDVMLSKQARGDAGPMGAYAQFMSELFSHLRGRFPQGLYYGFPGKRPFALGQRLGFYRGTGNIQEWRHLVQTLHEPPWPWWRLQELDWNNPRIDQLWSKHSSHHRGIVILDSQYLAWRYGRNPYHRYSLFGVRSGTRFVGWVVVVQDGDLLRCVDRVLDDRHWLPVLGLLAKHARTSGIHQLAWWAPNDTPRPGRAQPVETGLVGTVVTRSAPEFASIRPNWQPGDVDIY